MNRWLMALAVLLMLGFAPACMAQSGPADAPIVYRNAAEEARFHALASSLRCVMCQNESLADSSAMIAHDLRREILAMMRNGKSDAQIRDFLVARYGEFVLYQPRVEPATWLLWFGPPVLFLAGSATLLYVVRRRASRLGVPPPTSSSTAAPSVESSEEW